MSSNNEMDQFDYHINVDDSWTFSMLSQSPQKIEKRPDDWSELSSPRVHVVMEKKSEEEKFTDEFMADEKTVLSPDTKLKKLVTRLAIVARKNKDLAVRIMERDHKDLEDDVKERILDPAIGPDEVYVEKVVAIPETPEPKDEVVMEEKSPDPSVYETKPEPEETLFSPAPKKHLIQERKPTDMVTDLLTTTHLRQTKTHFRSKGYSIRQPRINSRVNIVTFFADRKNKMIREKREEQFEKRKVQHSSANESIPHHGGDSKRFVPKRIYLAGTPNKKPMKKGKKKRPPFVVMVEKENTQNVEEIPKNSMKYQPKENPNKANAKMKIDTKSSGDENLKEVKHQKNTVEKNSIDETPKNVKEISESIKESDTETNSSIRSARTESIDSMASKSDADDIEDENNLSKHEILTIVENKRILQSQKTPKGEGNAEENLSSKRTAAVVEFTSMVPITPMSPSQKYIDKRDQKLLRLSLRDQDRIREKKLFKKTQRKNETRLPPPSTVNIDTSNAVNSVNVPKPQGLTIQTIPSASSDDDNLPPQFRKTIETQTPKGKYANLSIQTEEPQKAQSTTASQTPSKTHQHLEVQTQKSSQEIHVQTPKASNQNFQSQTSVAFRDGEAQTPSNRKQDSEVQTPSNRKQDNEAQTPSRRQKDSECQTPKRRQSDGQAQTFTKKLQDGQVQTPKRRQADGEVQTMQKKLQDGQVQTPKRKQKERQVQTFSKKSADSETQTPKQKNPQHSKFSKATDQDLQVEKAKQATEEKILQQKLEAKERKTKLRLESKRKRAAEKKKVELEKIAEREKLRKEKEDLLKKEKEQQDELELLRKKEREEVSLRLRKEKEYILEQQKHQTRLLEQSQQYQENLLQNSKSFFSQKQELLKQTHAEHEDFLRKSIGNFAKSQKTYKSESEKVLEENKRAAETTLSQYNSQVEDLVKKAQEHFENVKSQYDELVNKASTTLDEQISETMGEISKTITDKINGFNSQFHALQTLTDRTLTQINKYDTIDKQITVALDRNIGNIDNLSNKIHKVEQEAQKKLENFTNRLHEHQLEQHVASLFGSESESTKDLLAKYGLSPPTWQKARGNNCDCSVNDLLEESFNSQFSVEQEEEFDDDVPKFEIALCIDDKPKKEESDNFPFSSSSHGTTDPAILQKLMNQIFKHSVLNAPKIKFDTIPDTANTITIARNKQERKEPLEPERSRSPEKLPEVKPKEEPKLERNKPMTSQIIEPSPIKVDQSTETRHYIDMDKFRSGISKSRDLRDSFMQTEETKKNRHSFIQTDDPFRISRGTQDVRFATTMETQTEELHRTSIHIQATQDETVAKEQPKVLIEEKKETKRELSRYEEMALEIEREKHRFEKEKNAFLMEQQQKLLRDHEEQSKSLFDKMANHITQKLKEQQEKQHQVQLQIRKEEIVQTDRVRSKSIGVNFSHESVASKKENVVRPPKPILTETEMPNKYEAKVVESSSISGDESIQDSLEESVDVRTTQSFQQPKGLIFQQKDSLPQKRMELERKEIEKVHEPTEQLSDSHVIVKKGVDMVEESVARVARQVLSEYFKKEMDENVASLHVRMSTKAEALKQLEGMVITPELENYLARNSLDLNESQLKAITNEALSDYIKDIVREDIRNTQKEFPINDSTLDKDIESKEEMAMMLLVLLLGSYQEEEEKKAEKRQDKSSMIDIDSTFEDDFEELETFKSDFVKSKDITQEELSEQLDTEKSEEKVNDLDQPEESSEEKDLSSTKSIDPKSPIEQIHNEAHHKLIEQQNDFIRQQQKFINDALEKQPKKDSIDIEARLQELLEERLKSHPLLQPKPAAIEYTPKKPNFSIPTQTSLQVTKTMPTQTSIYVGTMQTQTNSPPALSIHHVQTENFPVATQGIQTSSIIQYTIQTQTPQPKRIQPLPEPVPIKKELKNASTSPDTKLTDFRISSDHSSPSSTISTPPIIRTKDPDVLPLIKHQRQPLTPKLSLDHEKISQKLKDLKPLQIEVMSISSGESFISDIDTVGSIEPIDALYKEYEKKDLPEVLRNDKRALLSHIIREKQIFDDSSMDDEQYQSLWSSDETIPKNKNDLIDLLLKENFVTVDDFSED